MSYKFTHNNNPDASFVDNTIEEVRESVRDFFKLAMTIVDDDKVKDDFLQYPISKFNAIDTMNFEELHELLEENFDWRIEIE